MKNITLLLLSALYAFSLTSQSYDFDITWKEGEEKTITYSLTEEEMDENGKWIETSSETYDAQLKVLKNTDEKIKFNYTVKNIALESVIEFYEDLGEEDEIPVNDLKLIFEYSKATKEIDLKNWKEARDFMTSSFESIKDFLQKEKGDEADMLDFLFMPLINMFEDKETAQAQFITDVEFLFIPYEMSYEADKKITVTDSSPNPMDPTEEISASATYELKSSSEDDFTISREMELDMEILKQFIKEMMVEMFKAFLPEGEELPEDKLKELDDLEMTSVITYTADYNQSVGWVSKCVAVAQIDGNDPMSGERHNKKTNVITVK